MQQQGDIQSNEQPGKSRKTSLRGKEQHADKADDYPVSNQPCTSGAT